MTIFPTVHLKDLIVDDEVSFEHVALYSDLRHIVEASDHRFLVLRDHVKRPSWDRALFLNLTFWHAADPTDVLVDEHIAADVVAHVAWHLLAGRHLASEGGGLSAHAMLLSESIASAFDLYLVGRLLGHRPDSEFLQTQVPAMADSAAGAGMSEEELEALLETVAADPERAFEDLRALLFDAARALYACSDVESAAQALDALEGRRFAELLHHYELSNWVLYARAYGGRATGEGGEGPKGAAGDGSRAPRTGAAEASASGAQVLDNTLRKAPVALEWLNEHWVQPAIVHGSRPNPHRRATPR